MNRKIEDLLDKFIAEVIQQHTIINHSKTPEYARFLVELEHKLQLIKKKEMKK